MKNENRPSIKKAKVLKNTSPIEAFQNTVLRPIIKQLHLNLLQHLKNYLSTKNTDFFNLTLEKQVLYIATFMQKDHSFRQELKGMIIGRFTLNELQQYHLNNKEFGRRITQMILQRFIDSLPELRQLHLVSTSI